MVDGRHSGLLCEVVSLEPPEEGRSGVAPQADRQGWLAGLSPAGRQKGLAGRLGPTGRKRGLAGRLADRKAILLSCLDAGCGCGGGAGSAGMLPQLTSSAAVWPTHALFTPLNPLLYAERARVRLLPSYESVTVRCKELGEREEKAREEPSRPSSRGGSGGGGRSSRGEEERRHRDHHDKRGGFQEQG